jgi:hypothetical protein
MAQPSTETNIIRQEITALLNSIEPVHGIVERYNHLGGKAFFAEHLEDAQKEPLTDITADEFVTAVYALEQLQAYLTTHGPSLAKLRI